MFSKAQLIRMKLLCIIPSTECFFDDVIAEGNLFSCHGVTLNTFLFTCHKFAFDDICIFHDVQTTTKLELTVRDVI